MPLRSGKTPGRVKARTPRLTTVKDCRDRIYSKRVTSPKWTSARADMFKAPQTLGKKPASKKRLTTRRSVYLGRNGIVSPRHSKPTVASAAKEKTRETAFSPRRTRLSSVYQKKATSLLKSPTTTRPTRAKSRTPKSMTTRTRARSPAKQTLTQQSDISQRVTRSRSRTPAKSQRETSTGRKVAPPKKTSTGRKVAPPKKTSTGRKVVPPNKFTPSATKRKRSTSPSKKVSAAKKTKIPTRTSPAKSTPQKKATPKRRSLPKRKSTPYPTRSCSPSKSRNSSQPRGGQTGCFLPTSPRSKSPKSVNRSVSKGRSATAKTASSSKKRTASPLLRVLVKKMKLESPLPARVAALRTPNRKTPTSDRKSASKSRTTSATKQSRTTNTSANNSSPLSEPYITLTHSVMASPTLPRRNKVQIQTPIMSPMASGYQLRMPTKRTPARPSVFTSLYGSITTPVTTKDTMSPDEPTISVGDSKVSTKSWCTVM